MTNHFPTQPVDGPPPLAQVHGLLAAAAAPAAGVRFVVDTMVGPLDENDIAAQGFGGDGGGLERRADGSIWLRVPGADDERIWVPPEAGRERWLNGVAVYPYPPDPPEGWNACPSSGSQAEKGDGTNIPPPEFAALTVDLPITCTAQQVPDEAAFRARAVTVLAATDSYRVARELMGGETLGDEPQPFLADGLGTLPNGTGATKPNHGIQVLEEAIAATGRLGLIHCTPMLATALLGAGFALTDQSGVIRTINGNVVIADAGYVGVSQPNGAPAPGPTEEYAYATGPVDVRRSEIFTMPETLAEALDRGDIAATGGRTNQVTYRAERYFVTIWDTALQAAVLIDRCSTDCVVGS